MNVKARFELSLLCALVFSLLLSLCNVGARCKAVKQDVFRLHILAASDSEYDQNLKLKVRDAVLETSSSLFGENISKERAVDTACENLPKIVAAAQQTVYDCGADYKVTAEIKKCDFDTREYDGFTLPAGRYDALQIKIGEGRGHNWWCVLFPEVCIGSACDISDGLSPDAAEMVKSPDRYRVRFKLVEICEFLRKDGGGVR